MIPNFFEKITQPTIRKNPARCITDSSGKKCEVPLAGYDRRSYYLEDNNIFICENFGVLDSANCLSDIRHNTELDPQSAFFNVDSQATLQGLNSKTITSKTVLKLVLRLNEEAQQLPNGLTVRWVKAHKEGNQFRGNHFADSNARMGAEAKDLSYLLDPQDIPLRQLSAVKAELLSILRHQWHLRWTQNLLKNDAPADETKIWFPDISSKKAHDLIHNRPREDYSIIVQAITGFNHLANHEGRIDKSKNTSKICSKCRKPGSLMTTEHLFKDCDALATLRLELFGNHNPELTSLTSRQFCRFLSRANVAWLPVDDTGSTQ